MTLSGEWRSYGEYHAIIIVDGESNRVSQAVTADPVSLSKFLTDPGDLAEWSGRPVDEERRDPEAWGRLIISRADSGEVLDMDPESFWNGVYEWFRSRGVDYDSPQQ